MPLLTKEKFESLAKFKNSPCISIYMPTHRAGKDVLEEKDKIQLKSQWKKIYEQLKEKKISTDKIDELGKPVEQLLEDKNFWRHQSDGLAIFIGHNFFEKFSVPVNFEPMAHISDIFYLKPLVPLFTGDGRFYILSLQMDRVQLFEATKYDINELNIEEMVPSQLEDRVGFDYEEKNSKHQSVAQGASVSHGYGGAERDRKNEFLRFFRAVDKGLHPLLREEKAPLIVSCQDYLFPIYQEANTYQHLYDKCVPGNPSDFENRKALHQKAWEQIEPYFDKEKEQKMHQFREFNPGRTSKNIKEIIPAIFEGKVDTLFLQDKEDLWGNYNPDMASVEITDNSNGHGKLSLMNLAAVKVIEQGGTVYLVDQAFMPDMSSKMNAVYRYSK